MNYRAFVDELLLAHHRVCGIHVDVRAWDIEPHPFNGLLLSLIEDCEVVRLIHFALPLGKERDPQALLAIHSEACQVGAQWAP